MRKERHPTRMRSYALLGKPLLLLHHQHVVVPLVPAAAIVVMKGDERQPGYSLVRQKRVSGCVTVTVLLSPQLCTEALKDGWTR